MSGITATLRMESPNLALTETLVYDDTATVQPVANAGTVRNLASYMFTVQTDDLDRFETALDRDSTIDSYERIVEQNGEAVYCFEYGSSATVFSTAISKVNGISLNWTNDEAAWIVRVWLPDRAALATLREYAAERNIEFSLERVSDYGRVGEAASVLTQNQKETILLALEMGYFDEPRTATLSEVAAELGISQPAAGGRLRRAMKRLIVSTVTADREDEDKRT